MLYLVLSDCIRPYIKLARQRRVNENERGNTTLASAAAVVELFAAVFRPRPCDATRAKQDV
jgi:hypothetical protein